MLQCVIWLSLKEQHVVTLVKQKVAIMQHNYYVPSFGSSSYDFDDDLDFYQRRQRFAERLQQLEDDANIERMLVKAILVISIAVAVVGTACAFFL